MKSLAEICGKFKMMKYDLFEGESIGKLSKRSLQIPKRFEEMG